MTRYHRIVVESWAFTIRRAIEVGDGDAAYNLTRGLTARLRELGLL